LHGIERGNAYPLYINVIHSAKILYLCRMETQTIYYDRNAYPLGTFHVATLDGAICGLALTDNEAVALQEWRVRFPHATFVREDGIWDKLLQAPIRLHATGTDFQAKVWQALLRIPVGERRTYGQIAEEVGHPKAVRAVGTAVGSNPIAGLIPCHRVVRTSGALGGFHWGLPLKAAILQWEYKHGASILSRKM
jgi:AraC family transcriptional regulator of adaptative response/methylated-DNA-[protein]-cysteine methyltransferase